MVDLFHGCFSIGLASLSKFETASLLFLTFLKIISASLGVGEVSLSHSSKNGMLANEACQSHSSAEV